MGDRHRPLRELPFQVLAIVLGFDLGRFRQRKGGSEWTGACPVHQPKKNSTSFSYATDGRWNCFSCSAKGRGGIDLCMAVRKVGFQEAVEILQPHAGQAVVAKAMAVPKPELRQIQEMPAENEARTFTYEQHYQPSEWLQNRNLAAETLSRYGEDPVATGLPPREGCRTPPAICRQTSRPSRSPPRTPASQILSPYLRVPSTP